MSITARFFSNGSPQQKEIFSREDIPSTFCWLDFHSPEEKEIQVLKSLPDLHPLSVEDALEQILQPKIEFFPAYLFCILHEFHYTNGELEPAECDVFVHPSFFLTFHTHPLKSIEATLRLFPTFTEGNFTPIRLFHTFLENVLETFFPVLEKLEEDVEETERNALTLARKEVVEDIMHLRKNLSTLRRNLTQQNLLIHSLITGAHPLLSPETQAYFRDVYDHSYRILMQTDSLRETLNNAMEVYATTLSNRLNETMKILTGIATIFLPLTLVTGIYGMNFAFMPELRWRWGYPFSLALMLIIGVAFYWYLKRKYAL
ncbi:MAG: magnesium/cobalt transporter CorA [bacterium JZ-2024 1]